jgi:signal transduction histidine kinase
MATRKTSRRKKKPARSPAPRKTAARPVVTRPPRTSPDDREADALRIFAEIEVAAGSDARAMAERAAARALESFVRKMGRDFVKHVGALYFWRTGFERLLGQPELDRAALAAQSAEMLRAIKRFHRVLDRTRDAVLLTRRHVCDEPVASLVEEVRAAVVSELGGHAARFDFTADVEEGLTVHADHLHLSGALVDVVKNAAEAYPAESPRTPVHLSARARGRTIEIVVADEGHGWDAEALRHAFVPFRTDKPDGTGLGLYLARRAVEDLHGGRLTVESDGRGKGTRVRLVLARRQKDVKPRRRATPTEGELFGAAGQ